MAGGRHVIGESLLLRSDLDHIGDTGDRPPAAGIADDATALAHDDLELTAATDDGNLTAVGDDRCAVVHVAVEGAILAVDAHARYGLARERRSDDGVLRQQGV